MYSIDWINNINKTDILPPLHVDKSVKESEAWKIAVLDSFEHIARLQFQENLKFWDYYRMVDGKMSYMELKQVLPHLESIQDLLDGAGVPTWLHHYDILGAMVRDIVGKYIDVQAKFHVIDTGEVAENDFLRYKNEEIVKALNEVIEANVQRFLAENGMTMEGKEFSSEEEKQAYLQQIEQAKAKSTPKDTKRSTRSTFKTSGMLWGEATLEKDRETLKLAEKEKNELVDKLLTGRCFREYKILHDSYQAYTWSPKNTFFSKELGARYAQKGEYIGRLHYMTPSEVIKKHGPRIKTKTQKELLGGNKSWKNFVGDGMFSGTIEQAIGSNFNKPTWTPFANYADYNFYLGLQDELGTPMGQATWFEKDGTERTEDRFLPRYHNRYSGGYSYMANILRDDFEHRTDLCQVTEVYFIAYEKFGYLSYETESGRIEQAEVTEDILPEFLKENNITISYKESLHDIHNPIKAFEPNTLKWVLRPVAYKGCKIQSGNLQKPLYLYCEPCEHQIKGDSELDVILPVAGYIGKPWAEKVFPYQAAYNLVMNQIRNLLEKEVGIFFLLDVSLIPSEVDGWGDAQEAMIAMRNLAKDIGILPVQTSGDPLKNQNNFNQFTTHNLTYAGQIQYRLALADKYKMLAHETLGSNPQALAQPTKYATAEGVQVSQDASFAQLSEIYQEFDDYNQSALEVHLAVAQYCQSNKKDLSVSYTKSDGSMAFLRLTDPSFPLRRMGLLPVQDAKKRKELEQFKQRLLMDNTLQAEPYELARLMTSDAMQDLLDVAQEAMFRRQEQGGIEHQRAVELEQSKAQFTDELETKKHERKLKEIQLTNEGKYGVAEITAKGRAADKQADPESFAEIEQSSERALKQNKLEQETAIKNRALDQKDKQAADSKTLAIQKLKLEAEKVRASIANKAQDVQIAAMNKN